MTATKMCNAMSEWPCFLKAKRFKPNPLGTEAMDGLPPRYMLMAFKGANQMVSRGHQVKRMDCVQQMTGHRDGFVQKGWADQRHDGIDGGQGKHHQMN